jgi:hypothetical protein
MARIYWLALVALVTLSGCAPLHDPQTEASQLPFTPVGVDASHPAPQYVLVPVQPPPPPRPVAPPPLGQGDTGYDAVYNAGFKAGGAEACKLIDSEEAEESIWAEIFLHFYYTEPLAPIMAAADKGKAAGVEDLKHEPGLCGNFSPNILEAIEYNVAIYRGHVLGVQAGWQR